MHDMGGRDSFHVEKNQPDLMRKRNFYEVAILYEFVQCDSYGFLVKKRKHEGPFGKRFNA